MNEIIKNLVLKLNASSGAIMVVDDNAQLLKCRASYNMPDVWIKLVNPIENNPPNTNGYVAFTGKAKIVNGLNKLFHGYFISSLIVVPIKNSGKVIGNIEIITDNKNRTFNDSDQYVIEVAAKDLLAPKIQEAQT